MGLKKTSKCWPTSYVPAPDLPRWAARELEVFGGYNPYGQPNYRFQWGMDARGFLNGNPQAMKYANPNDTELGYACWMLERWASQEFFNLEQWNEHRYGEDTAGTGKQIDYLGPFPNRGEYILVAPLITEDGEMLPINDALIQEIKRRVLAGSQTESVLGMLEIKRRLKIVATKEKVALELEEVRERYRRNKNKPEHTAQFILGTGVRQTPVLPPPDPKLISQATKILLS